MAHRKVHIPGAGTKQQPPLRSASSREAQYVGETRAAPPSSPAPPTVPNPLARTPLDAMFVQVLVPEDDCFIAAMLTAASVLEGIPKENPSNEEKRIWCAVNAPVINQFRQKMASVLFTIHTGATQAWGGEAINKLFGDYHFNKNRWRKMFAQDEHYNPWQPGTWGGDIELAALAWVLQVNLHVLTRTDESAPLDKRSVRSFRFDDSAKTFLHLTGSMQPLLNTDLSGDENVLPQMDNFVIVDVQQLVEDVKSPCFFEILGFPRGILMCWTRNSTLSSQKISCRDDQMFLSCTMG